MCLVKSSSGVDLEQSWGSSACWEQHWISLSASENSENSVPLLFVASSTETVGNPLLFLSGCFSCCPKSPQPVSRAGLFAQCLPRAWLGFPGGFQPLQAQSTACLPLARQELLGVSCSWGNLEEALGWPGHQHPLSCFLVPFPSISARAGAGARFDFLVGLCAVAARGWCRALVFVGEFIFVGL